MSQAARRSRPEVQSRAPTVGAHGSDEGRETRLNLVYKGSAVREVLDRIQEKGHHGTATEAVATALRMYERMLLEREAGNRIVVLDRKGGIPLQLL